MKEINGKRSGKSALEIDDVLPIDTDLNSVIRENFEFLKEQMVIDACDVRFIREDGKDWVKKRTGKTIQEIAKSDESIRFRLESFRAGTKVGEGSDVPSWRRVTEVRTGTSGAEIVFPDGSSALAATVAGLRNPAAPTG